MAECHAECHFKALYAECRYTDCRGANVTEVFAPQLIFWPD